MHLTTTSATKNRPAGTNDASPGTLCLSTRSAYLYITAVHTYNGIQIVSSSGQPFPDVVILCLNPVIVYIPYHKMNATNL